MSSFPFSTAFRYGKAKGPAAPPAERAEGARPQVTPVPEAVADPAPAEPEAVAPEPVTEGAEVEAPMEAAEPPPTVARLEEAQVPPVKPTSPKQASRKGKALVRNPPIGVPVRHRKKRLSADRDALMRGLRRSAARHMAVRAGAVRVKTGVADVIQRAFVAVAAGIVQAAWCMTEMRHMHTVTEADIVSATESVLRRNPERIYAVERPAPKRRARPAQGH